LGDTVKSHWNRAVRLVKWNFNFAKQWSAKARPRARGLKNVRVSTGKSANSPVFSGNFPTSSSYSASLGASGILSVSLCLGG
jgi:hypothetical protein